MNKNIHIPDFDTMHMGSFSAASLPGTDVYDRAYGFERYVLHEERLGRWNYRVVCKSGCLPEVELELPYALRHITHKTFVATVFNDYLGFSQ